VITIDPVAAARSAVAAHPDRPATAVLLDNPDVRLIVFRLAPGQAVPPHSSPSSVTLTVLAGTGVISGGTDECSCSTGTVVGFAPEELHGMRAEDDELLLLAAVTPRPGLRSAERSLTRERT
jgi:quercetin dioxygenase-like cupin family protein